MEPIGKGIVQNLLFRLQTKVGHSKQPSRVGYVKVSCLHGPHKFS